MSMRGVVTVVGLMGLAACSPKPSGSSSGTAGVPAVGSEGAHCYGNGTCDAALTCFSNLCVSANGSSGASVGDASSAPVSNGATSQPLPNSSAGASNSTNGAPDLEWAEWHIPPDSPTAYTFDADTVVDTVTGLTWQRVVPAGRYTWADAKTYCAGLVLAGAPTWRLPTRIELRSIVDLSVTNPAINQTAFPSTPTDAFWSASPLVNYSGSAWGVYFNSGDTSSSSVSSSFRVRCVR